MPLILNKPDILPKTEVNTATGFEEFEVYECVYCPSGYYNGHVMIAHRYASDCHDIVYGTWLTLKGVFAKGTLQSSKFAFRKVKATLTINS